MALCAAGHDSVTDDYCSICGMPMADAATGDVEPVTVNPPEAGQTCPVCHTVASADAFFCENCGYDFLTGSLPRGAAAPVPSEPVAPVIAPVTTLQLDETPPRAPLDNPLVLTQAPLPQPPPPVRAPSPAPSPSPARPRPVDTGSARWVAEIWIDPEWYRVQQAPEPLPSPGQPLITALRKSTVVIGRGSPSGHPDLDCQTDTGVSRRQAVLITDGARWFVEDLGSSNGTYLGQVDQPMPTQPITGRVELGPHDRIYLGSWTRIVVRPALVQEADL